MINKFDSTTGAALPGAVFQLANSNGCFITGVTDRIGRLVICLPAAGAYTLTEISAPPGYLPAPRTYNVLVYAADYILVDGVPTNQIFVPNTPNTPATGAFTATKVNIVTGAPLAGAVFTLSQNGATVNTVTSNALGQVAFSNLAPGTYQLVETTAPGGFQPNPDPLTVVVAANGTVTIDGQPANGYVLNNTPIGGLAFVKTDAATGLPLAGATFTLSQGGTTVDTAVSNAQGIVNFGTPAAGTYQLTETDAPDGYTPDATVYTVIVAANGTVTVDDAPVDDFTVANTPTAATPFAFTAIKVNTATLAPLAGAVFTLSQGGATVDIATSNATGEVSFADLTAGEYDLTETTSPDGFQPNPDVMAVTVAADGSVTIDGAPADGYTLYNAPLGDVAFVKTGADTGLPLPGATFTLSQGGVEITDITSDGDGIVDFGQLASGTYQLEETTAPAGYALNPTEYTVVVNPDGSVTVGGAPLAEFAPVNTPVAVETSAAPTIDAITVDDTVITGTGVPDASITVTFPNLTESVVTVTGTGTWSVPVSVTLAEGQTISAVQTEPGKTVSSVVTEPVTAA